MKVGESMENLKKLRADSNKTQAEFAEFLGINALTYREYEQGRRAPSNKGLIDLAKKLDVSIDYLLGISNIRTINKFELTKGTLLELTEEFFDNGSYEDIYDYYMRLTTLFKNYIINTNKSP